METAISQAPMSVGQQILNLHNKLSKIPCGNFFFNRILAFKVPYSASIGARIVELKPGYAKLCLKDKKSIRNHLNSIHAVALVNFGEMTSGLSLLTGLPDNVRGIVIQINTEYVKKARGTLMAECSCVLPVVTQDTDYTVEAIITDAEQDIVAKVKVLWRLGLRQDK